LTPRAGTSSRRSAEARSAAASRSRRWLLIVLAAAAGVGIALGISRLDVERAIQEVTLPLRHDDIIRQQAQEKQLDPALIAAVIYSESRFRDQTSNAGAIGLMQVTPATASAIAQQSGGTQFTVQDLENPEINIRYGTYHLRALLDRYGGNEVAALAAYNAGSGNVDKWGGADLSVNDIRFPETQAYVDEVLQKRGEYRDKYADDLGLNG
jgi:soluble lytic murein transglycosylase